MRKEPIATNGVCLFVTGAHLSTLDAVLDRYGGGVAAEAAELLGRTYPSLEGSCSILADSR